MGLVALLIIILHASVLYPRARCLASLGTMSQEPVHVEHLQMGLKAKVELYEPASSVAFS